MCDFFVRAYNNYVLLPRAKALAGGQDVTYMAGKRSSQKFKVLRVAIAFWHTSKLGMLAWTPLVLC